MKSNDVRLSREISPSKRTAFLCGVGQSGNRQQWTRKDSEEEDHF